MRVIAGRCRSMPLKTLPGKNTRPTTDRIKETLFNMLMPYVPGSRFLDLFAGSGAIGIEALSRGAEYCCFIEQNRSAGNIIRDNLRFTRLDNNARLLQADVFAAFSRLRAEKPFDIVFMDPPYLQGLEKNVLIRLKDEPFVSKNTLFVVEAAKETDFSWIGEAGYVIIKQKIYKTNEHLFLSGA